MRVKYSSAFIKTLKRANVRIRKSVWQRIGLFSQYPHQPQLNNHPLRREYQGYRSIDITSDWRAVYEEIEEGGKPTAYFFALGTHRQLYKQKKNLSSLN